MLRTPLQEFEQKVSTLEGEESQTTIRTDGKAQKKTSQDQAREEAQKVAENLDFAPKCVSPLG